jgi:hypothetical protein
MAAVRNHMTRKAIPAPSVTTGMAIDMLTTVAQSALARLLPSPTHQ